MLVNCDAPDCKKKVQISGMAYISKMVTSAMCGGDLRAAVFCPEHDERITNGKHDDGDPNTNPDLNKKK